MRNNNPGNIRGTNGEFRKFNSPQEGLQALHQQLDLYKTGRSAHTTGKENLKDLFHIYAPASDNNNPDNYAKFVADYLNIPINTPISQIDTNKLAEAITKFESPQMYKILYG